MFNSLTAPKVSFEEWLKEKESMSEEERQQVDADVFGRSSASGSVDEAGGTVQPDEEGIAVAIREMENAVQLLDAEDKEAYLQAREQCSHLVDRESNPHTYLRRHDWDPSTAARQVASYWQRRKSIFLDRCFLPMDITGGGAMDDHDIALLRLGVYVLLPDDEHGRLVVYYEPSRSYGTPERSQKCVRCIFYTLTVAVMNHAERGQKLHGVGLLNTWNSRAELADRRTARMAIDIARIMPLRIVAIHHINRSNSTWTSFVAPVVLYLAGSALRLRYQMHYPASLDLSHDLLAPYGLQQDILPTILGGAWDVLLELKNWIARRRQAELAVRGG